MIVSTAIAVVPARLGSKGIPLKNLREVGGRSLVRWSVAAALRAGLVGHVIVSSDSVRILEEASREKSARIFGRRRPPALATDTAATDPVIVDALTWYRDTWGKPLPEFVVLLQPTSPLRAPGLIDRCIMRARETGADSVMTVVPAHFVWSRVAGAWRCNAEPLSARPRRQDLTDEQRRWLEDGSVYVTRTDSLLSTGSRLCGKIETVETEPTPDVDTDRDLAMAESLAEWLRRKG